MPRQQMMMLSMAFSPGRDKIAHASLSSLRYSMLLPSP
jgi:hypothetical protein